jgi:hypothetical protein
VAEQQTAQAPDQGAAGLLAFRNALAVLGRSKPIELILQLVGEADNLLVLGDELLEVGATECC